jgi:hypothetical protein
MIQYHFGFMRYENPSTSEHSKKKKNENPYAYQSLNVLGFFGELSSIFLVNC